MRPYILLMLLLTTAACTSPQERAQQEAQKEVTECTKAGYQPATAAFDDCRLEVRAKEEQKAQERVKESTDIPSLQPNHPDTSQPTGVSIPFP